MCIKNFEECITRYPEHFKSIYHLILIYKNGPEKVRDVNKCHQLLLGTYTTELGNQVQGLFTDRKNNNLFNVSMNELNRKKNEILMKIIESCRVFGGILHLKSNDREVFHVIFQNVLVY